MKEKDNSTLIIGRRNLPHWEIAGATYFVTFQIKEGRLSTDEVVVVLGHIKQGDPSFYELFAATVMPDHVHIILRPRDGVSLSRVTKGIKGVTARLVNSRRGRRGTFWRDESYDRIIRNEKEMEKTIEYVFSNALKRGLCVDGWEYPGFYLKEG